MKKSVRNVMALLLCGIGAGGASADLVYDTNLTRVNGTNGVIFGSGNNDLNFAVGQDDTGDFEVGLRAKNRATGATLVQPGTNVYSVATGVIWNFDWAVNTNVQGGGGELEDYTYEFILDYYTVADGRQTFRFDPITQPSPAIFYDHALGTNSTAQAPGHPHVATSAADYADDLENFNIAQNSTRLDWNPGSPHYNINENATFHITLAILDGSTVMSSSNIWVNVGQGAPVVPVPAAAPLGLVGMGLIAFLRRRKKATAA